MRNWRLIPLWTLAAIVWSIVFLVYTPVYLAKFLSRLAFRWLYRLQDIVSEIRRRLKYGYTNSNNQAAQLPQELQLQLFSLLRSRAAFGRTERLMDEREPDNAGVFGGCRDLAAARLVCRAWTDAATEALYADVTLVTARACIAFAAALLVHPQRPLLVRRIVLPGASLRVYNSMPQLSAWQTLLYDVGGVRKMVLKAAIDRIVIQCTRATDVAFFRSPAARVLEEVPGLMQCAPRITHLTLRHLEGEEPFCTNFPLEALVRFPHLQSLTLQRQNLTGMPDTMPPLKTLRLGRCFVSLDTLQSLLARLPNLLVLSLRDTVVLDYMPTVPLARLVMPAHAVLEDCTLVDSPRVSVPRSLDFFCALRRLTISAAMLAKARDFPPLLRELIVTTAPSPSSERVSARWRGKALFDIARCLLRLRAWDVPCLRSVQLWDTVLLSQLPDYGVVAYILHETLRSAGIEVAVNLFLCAEQEWDVRGRFLRRDRIRRLLWQDVI